MSMRAAVYSDLHLEFQSIKLKPGKVDVVIVPGDVLPIRLGNAVAWLDKAIPRKTPVIFVPGNHDYYGGNVVDAHAAWRAAALASKGHVSLLINDRLCLDGVNFLGTPLYSDLSLPGVGSPAAMAAIVENGISDFGAMKRAPGERWRVSDMVAASKVARAFLDSNLPDVDAPGTAPVVVTHWAPSYRSCGHAYLGNMLNPYFIVEAEALVARSQVWIHGHLHSPSNYQLGGRQDRGRVYCNPRGYIYRNGAKELPGTYGPLLIDIDA